MSLYESILNEAVAKAKAANPRGEKDFIKDGILHCGVCGAPKQTKASIPIIGKMAFIDCECVKAEKQKQADRIRAQRVETLRNECFDSPKMRKWTFDRADDRNAEMKRICRHYAENFNQMDGKGLVLFGEKGTGKTVLACCITNALVDKGIRCRCTSFIEQSHNQEDLTQYGFVFLDDFGAERDTSFMEEVVFYTVDTLYRFGIPFVLTTNMTAEDIKRSDNISLGRVLSRLYEVCYFHEFKGSDRRREILKADTANYREMLKEAK